MSPMHLEPLSDQPSPSGATTHSRGRSFGARLPGWTGAALALAAMVAATSIANPAFAKPTNLLNILNQNAVPGIVAVAMTLTIILGGIDLSVGALLALAGGLGISALNAALASGAGDAVGWLAAVVVTLGIGVAAGALNGLLVAKGRLAPFVATLGTLVAYRSIATWIAQGGQFFARGSTWFAAMGRGIPIPGTNLARPGAARLPVEFPYAVVLWVIVALLGHAVLQRTRYGRHVVAVGSNEKAARYSAVAVDRVKWIAYTLTGGAVGLAALLFAARYESVNSANAGLLMELEAIAAVVIGGTRMEGGRGSVAGTVVGVLLIGAIKNMIVMLGVTSYAHGLVMGVIIVAAVLVQRLATPRG